MRTDGDVLLPPKLRPEIESLAPPACGPFKTAEAPTPAKELVGASNENVFMSVPTRESMVDTTILD